MWTVIAAVAGLIVGFAGGWYLAQKYAAKAAAELAAIKKVI